MKQPVSIVFFLANKILCRPTTKYIHSWPTQQLSEQPFRCSLPVRPVPSPRRIYVILISILLASMQIVWFGIGLNQFIRFTLTLLSSNFGLQTPRKLGRFPFLFHCSRVDLLRVRNSVRFPWYFCSRIVLPSAFNTNLNSKISRHNTWNFELYWVTELPSLNYWVLA